VNVGNNGNRRRTDKSGYLVTIRTLATLTTIRITAALIILVTNVTIVIQLAEVTIISMVILVIKLVTKLGRHLCKMLIIFSTI